MHVIPTKSSAHSITMKSLHGPENGPEVAQAVTMFSPLHSVNPTARRVQAGLPGNSQRAFLQQIYALCRPKQ